MKKSLIALAVLAASGAAMAQSSVTLYGVVDAWFGTVKSGVGAASVSQTKLDSATLNGSRWGLKGSEDLGGGLSAIFTLEQGINVDDGSSSSTRAFHRQAWVGLKGGFGAVTLGRNYSPYDDVHGAITPNADSTINSMGAVAAWGSLGDYSSRIDNAIKYQSNDFGGISGAVLVGLGEDKTATLSASQTTALNVKYSAGPVMAALGYQQQTPQGSGDKTKFTMLGGTYNLGMAKLHAAYENAKMGTLKDTGYSLGVDVPVGSAATVSFGYSKSKGEAAGATTSNTKGFSILGQYDMSKRTAAYAGWNDIKEDNNAGVDTRKTSTFRVGVRHKF